LTFISGGYIIVDLYDVLKSSNLKNIDMFIFYQFDVLTEVRVRLEKVTVHNLKI
jgi:hypothetical protein